MNATGETDEADVIVTVYDIQSGKTPEKMKIDVLYEDDYVIAVNKPSG